MKLLFVGSVPSLSPGGAFCQVQKIPVPWFSATRDEQEPASKLLPKRKGTNFTKSYWNAKHTRGIGSGELTAQGSSVMDTDGRIVEHIIADGVQIP